MKYLFTFLFLALQVAIASAQTFELVRPADFRYYVTVDQDTVATRSLDYKAYQDAVEYKCRFPNSTVIVRPSGVEVRGCPALEPEYIYDEIIVEIIDTVYVTELDTVFVFTEDVITDTLYVELRDTVLIGLQNVEWEHRISNGDVSMLIEGNSESTVSIRWGCNQLEQSGSWGVHEGFFRAEIPTTCTETFVFEVVHRDGSYQAIYSDSVPMNILAPENQWVFTPANFDPAEWTQYWHGSSLLWTGDDFIAVQDTASGSNVWIHNEIPHTSEMEIYMEASTLAATAHIRALATPYGYAQDIYFTTGGDLHYAYWSNTDPDQPWAQRMYTLVEQIPIGIIEDRAKMLLRVDNDQVFIKVWGEEEPEEWSFVTNVVLPYVGVEGGVGIGAHSVATRQIYYLSVGIDGQQAPRPEN